MRTSLILIVRVLIELILVHHLPSWARIEVSWLFYAIASRQNVLIIGITSKVLIWIRRGSHSALCTGTVTTIVLELCNLENWVVLDKIIVLSALDLLLAIKLTRNSLRVIKGTHLLLMMMSVLVVQLLLMLLVEHVLLRHRSVVIMRLPLWSIVYKLWVIPFSQVITALCVLDLMHSVRNLWVDIWQMRRPCLMNLRVLRQRVEAK